LTSRRKETEVKWLAMVLQVVLFLVFVSAAVPKLLGAGEEMRMHLGVAPWFWVVTSIAELVGAVGMAVGLRFPKLAAASGLWISAIMAGAAISHLRVGDPAANLIPPAVLLALASTVTAVRVGGRK
jgi:uncharacterized membrane protein YphA (DoxX/SURF4 family)